MLQDRPEDFWLLSDNSRLTKGEAQILEDGGPPNTGDSKLCPKESGSGPGQVAQLVRASSECAKVAGHLQESTNGCKNK